MAVLRRMTIGGRTYEVRGAGSVRRLLVDGVLHSAWSPRAPLTGAVWDPLALAAVLAREGRPRSALLLGLGGGAAVHLLLRHFPVRRIVAVELDGTGIAVARRWFGLGDLERAGRLRIVHADALEYARRSPRGRFDVVIDDVFGGSDGEPVRAAGGRAWWKRLAARTASGGVLVANFAETRDLRAAGLERDPALRRRFRSAAVFSCPGYTNRIVALSEAPEAAATFRERLASLPTLPRGRSRGPRFRTSSLW